MEATNPQGVNRTEQSAAARQQLSNVFGSYKAEWLTERIFEFFTEPAFLPELLTPRPCVLIGGRGTGKTTVLRSLSHHGQRALYPSRPLEHWDFLGFYYRANMNRVQAFKGPEIDDHYWQLLFSHYLNLVLTGLVLRFLSTTEKQSGDRVLDPTDCQAIAVSLHLDPQCQNAIQLEAANRMALIAFEAHINNIVDSPRPALSMAGAPIDLLAEAIQQSAVFRGKPLFFLIDEYENFLPYQQRAINTLIKHSGELYAFKIGVRDLSWVEQRTLDDEQPLIYPADYVRINISESLSGSIFSDFARLVCERRLAGLQIDGYDVLTKVADVLPGLTEDDEAIRLGVMEKTQEFRRSLSDQGIPDRDLAPYDSLSPLQAYLLDYWAQSTRQSPSEVYRSFLRDRAEWDTRYSNYKHASIYTIRRRKRGIRKYYAGWNVYTQLASTNIRYLLQLVETALSAQVLSGSSLSVPVSPEVQTGAAQDVGAHNLQVLQGLAKEGAQLTKLALSLGRIFGVMASLPEGHTPEVNQFEVVAPARTFIAEALDIDSLLRLAVMHQALIRFPGTKLTDEADTRDYDYSLHPIYAALFEFSYRRKRKMTLRAEEIVGLIQQPSRTISLILDRSRRHVEEELPEQLYMFAQHYADNP